MASEITSYQQRPRFICDYETIRSLNKECDQIVDEFKNRGLFQEYCGPYAAWIALRLLGRAPTMDVFFSCFPMKVERVNKWGSYNSEVAGLIGRFAGKQICMQKNANVDRLLRGNQPVVVSLNDDFHFTTIIGSDQDCYYVLDYDDILAIEKSKFIKAGHECIYAE